MKAFKLEYLANTNKPFKVTLMPKASHNQIKMDDTRISVYVTSVPENGKAKAIGIPKSKLTLLRGASSRRKTFKIEG